MRPRIPNPVRDEARKLGLKRYRSGVPCKNGHLHGRHVSNDECVECAAENFRGERCLKFKSENLAKVMLKAARIRAARLGLPFEITPADIVIPKMCPVLGVELKCGVGRLGQYSPSLDRLDPSLGYIRTNVTVISFRANSIKQDASSDELRAVADWMDRVTKR